MVVEVQAGGERGLGYSYTSAAGAAIVRDTLAAAVEGRNALDVGAAWAAMAVQVRNLGRPGIASAAISAVGIALWHLKARLLDVPLVVAIDAVHERVPIYGSGGFSSYSIDRLREQLGGWVQQGIPRVKTKVGREPALDLERVKAVRDVIGGADLLVDANGALTRKQALAWAGWYADLGVVWFEEPVSSDDLDGLRLLRDRGPAGP